MSLVRRLSGSGAFYPARGILAADTLLLDGTTYAVDWEDDFNTFNTNNWNKIEPTVWGGGENDAFNLTHADPYVEDSILKLPISYVQGSGGPATDWWQSGVLGANQQARTTLQGWSPPFVARARVMLPYADIPQNETWKSQDDQYKGGIWSALWMLGGYPTLYGFTDANGNWPILGEIDWFECQEGETWRNAPDRYVQMVWANMHQQLNSKAQENPPVLWDTQTPKQIEDNNWFEGIWHETELQVFYDSTASDVLTHKVFFDDIQVAHWIGSDEASNWGSIGDPYTNNSHIVTRDRVDWGGGSAAGPYDYDNGPIGSPFDNQFYFVINSAVKGGGPVTQNVTPWTINDGKEFWVDWIKVYKPVS